MGGGIERLIQPTGWGGRNRAKIPTLLTPPKYKNKINFARDSDACTERSPEPPRTILYGAGVGQGEERGGAASRVPFKMSSDFIQ